MQWWEVNRYLSGLHRRYHSNYESARLLQWTLACIFHDKTKPAPSSPQDMYKFGWEKSEKEPAPVITQEDYEHELKLLQDFKW